jgi:hypothetical protein
MPAPSTATSATLILWGVVAANEFQGHAFFDPREHHFSLKSGAGPSWIPEF